MYVFAKGRPHFEAMIFACATGLAVLLVAAPLFRTSEVPGPAIGQQPRVRASAVPTATVRRPNASEIDSAWASQSPAATISVGGEATMTVQFRNTGTVAWTRGTVAEASLAFTGDDRLFDPHMAVDWPLPSRPATQSESDVVPGQLATFTFKVRGVVPGTYRIDVRPTIVSVGWLRDEGVYVEITVR